MIENVLKRAGLGLAALAVCTLAAGAQTGSSPDTTPASPPSSPLTPGKLASAAAVTYANKFEVYGGINLQNFQAGQDLPKRMNLGGVEISGTYWTTRKLGVVAEFRGEAGTTPVFANPYTTRPLVVLYTGMAGVQYRGPKNQRAAINYHAYGGISHGDFTRTPLPTGYDVGLYSNRTKPIFALGGSVDFNRSKNLAFRLSPDLIIEHFGSETREFFAISGGAVYRFGKK